MLQEIAEPLDADPAVSRLNPLRQIWRFSNGIEEVRRFPRPQPTGPLRAPELHSTVGTEARGRNEPGPAEPPRRCQSDRL